MSWSQEHRRGEGVGRFLMRELHTDTKSSLASGRKEEDDDGEEEQGSDLCVVVRRGVCVRCCERGIA